MKCSTSPLAFLLMIAVFACTMVFPILPDTFSLTGENDESSGRGSPINVEAVEIKRLYAAEHELYKENAVGTVTLYNASDSEVQVVLILTGERYIEAPMKSIVILPAAKRMKVPLYVDLVPDVVNLGKSVEHIPISIVIYTYAGSKESGSLLISRELMIYDRHKLPNAGTAKVAIFVNPRDEHVKSAVDMPIEGSAREKAAAVFALLQKRGIHCVGDGSTYIQYPRELLRTNLGSSYDCSLLYSAILELLDVETKVVFDSDRMLPSYKAQGRWCPVDMNLLSSDFPTAQKSGALLEQEMVSAGARSVVLRDAWRKYPPLKFPTLESDDMTLFRSVDGCIDENGLDVASEVLKQLLQKYPNQPVLLNSSANVDFLMGNIRRAIEKYSRAVKRASHDGGLYLNLGIAYNKLGDKDKGTGFIRRAYSKIGSYADMCQLLDLTDGNEYCCEVDSLLRKAIGLNGDTSSVALGTRTTRGSHYPLYWKQFQ